MTGTARAVFKPLDPAIERHRPGRGKALGPRSRRSLYSASSETPICRAACVTIPLAASAALNARCCCSVIGFARGAGCR